MFVNFQPHFERFHYCQRIERSYFISKLSLNDISYSSFSIKSKNNLNNKR